MGFWASEELNLELTHGVQGLGFRAWGWIKSTGNPCLTLELTPFCHQAKTGCIFARRNATLSLHCLKRHAASTQHLKSVCMLIQGSADGIPTDKCHEILGAPPLSAFTTLMREIAAGRSIHAISKLNQVGGRRKLLGLLWCADDALKQWLGSKLDNATTIALLRDAAHSRLLVRIAAIGKDFRPFSALLGMQRLGAETGADSINEATNAIIKRFATRYSDWKHSMLQPAVTGQYNQSRAHHIRAMVHVVATDAASDELLAIAMARRPDIHAKPGTAALTPNVVVVCRDRSHACKRLLHRPFQAATRVKQRVNNN